MSNCVWISDGSCQSQWVWQCCSCTLVLSPSPSPCLPASSAAPSNTILHIIDIGRHWEESVVDPDPVQSGTFRPGQIGKSHWDSDHGTVIRPIWQQNLSNFLINLVAKVVKFALPIYIVPFKFQNWFKSLAAVRWCTLTIFEFLIWTGYRVGSGSGQFVADPQDWNGP
jgi:hypothetical protein